MFFFPIGDDNTERRLTPVVNYVLIAINVLVFLYQMGHDEFTLGYSVVPAEITQGHDIVGSVRGVSGLRLYPSPSPIYLTMLSSMFMHGGFLHLGGNMLYLWIFGDNVEDRMGHLKYLIFYLLCGVLASATHIFFSPNSMIPSLGASGAIAGVLGAYLVLFPRQGVRVIQFGMIVEVPALIVIGLWGLLQVFSGVGSVGSSGGGVAYMAHVGGFIAGILLVFLFRNPPEPRRVRRDPDYW
ncbi:MAG TPA: rhomboid family intramembrane serine protease [Blastocatellia bacterium]|nr:rhomboid family intramembrane serine protease [Blastocatellia bacterium]